MQVARHIVSLQDCLAMSLISATTGHLHDRIKILGNRLLNQARYPVPWKLEDGINMDVRFYSASLA